MSLRMAFLSKRFKTLQPPPAGGAIASISSDSRKLGSGALFVAVRGRRTDGHQFLSEAAQKGAAALLLERDAPWPSGFKGGVFKAADSRSALSAALNEFYDFPSQKLFAVGVTGTNGKTTVSYMLERIFSRLGWPAGVIGTIDQHFKKPAGRRGGFKGGFPSAAGARGEGFSRPAALTTPEPVELFQALDALVKKGAKALAMEVSSIGLDQRRIEGVEFQGAVFTNLTPDHLDYHLSMDNYFRAKKKLFEPAPAQKNFFCVINKDDPHGRKLLGSKGPPYYSYGEKDADFSFDVESQTLSGTVFSLRSPFGSAKARLPLPGIHNVYNAAAALACGAVAGFSLKAAAEALEDFPGVPGRLERAGALSDPFQVFVDYAHTPLALRAVLQTLRRFAGGKRLVTVFGCGGGRDRQKRAPMAETALEFSDHAFFTSDNPRHEDPAAIIKEGMKGLKKESLSRLEAVEDRREAIEKAINFAAAGDIVLIAGKGHETVQIIGDRRIPFDDRKIAGERLARLKKRGG